MFRHCLMWSSGILLRLFSKHLTGKKIYSISDCLIEMYNNRISKSYFQRSKGILTAPAVSITR